MYAIELGDGVVREVWEIEMSRTITQEPAGASSENREK